MATRPIDARGRFLLLAAIAVGLSCGSTTPPLQPLCLYNGTHYKFGDSFPSVDGCATCSCSTGGVICGHRACPPDAGGDDAAVDAAVSDAASPRDARADRGGATDVGVDVAPTDTGSGPPDVAPPTCALDHTYRFRSDGGRVAYTDVSMLSPPRTQLMVRDRRNGSFNTCTRELPCNVPGLVDVAAIQRALADPDVVAALAMNTPPFYGVDTRPSDGQVFIFERVDDGHGFSAGSGTVPPGIRALATLLLTLQGETAATPMCASL